MFLIQGRFAEERTTTMRDTRIKMHWLFEIVKNEVCYFGLQKYNVNHNLKTFYKQYKYW